MKQTRMVDFLERFMVNTKISVSDERGNIFYTGTVGDAPQSVWMKKDLAECLWSPYGQDFLITVKPRPVSKKK